MLYSAAVKGVVYKACILQALQYICEFLWMEMSVSRVLGENSVLRRLHEIFREAS